MIGSGIFIVSSDVARQVKSPGLLILCWLIGAALTIIAALSYGELAAAMPQAGGQYVYLREAFGRLWGFLYGWTLFVVIQTGTIAAVAVAFAKYAGVFLPSISAGNYLLGSGKAGLTTQQLLAIAVVLLLTIVNTRGIRTGALVQNVFTFAKVASILGLVGLGFLLGRNPQAVAANFTDFWRNASWSWATVALVGSAMVGPLFSSDAWNNVTFTAGEVRNPKRNLPLSLGIGVGTVSILYIACNFIYLSVLTLPQIQTAPEDRVATAVVSVMFGPVATKLMAIAIMISTFGCCNGMIMSGARVYFTMARDDLFFRRAGTLDPVQRTVQRSARLCYLCSSAVLHSDHRRPLSTPPHTPRSGSSLPCRRLPGAPRPVYAGGRCHRSFVVDQQAHVHGTRVDSGVAGSACLLSVA
jgi:APA family basic amino acid/polyamine antiporter